MKLFRRFVQDRQGSELVETALLLVPLCGLVFLLSDVAWGVFVKATLQHAVREGARYAMTGNVQSGLGQLASIKSVVRRQAMGLLDGEGASKIVVRFYAPDTLAETADNRGGNLVIVSVEGYPFKPLAPFLHSSSTVPLTLRSGDRMEPSSSSGPPAL